MAKDKTAAKGREGYTRNVAGNLTSKGWHGNSRHVAGIRQPELPKKKPAMALKPKTAEIASSLSKDLSKPTKPAKDKTPEAAAAPNLVSPRRTPAFNILATARELPSDEVLKSHPDYCDHHASATEEERETIHVSMEKGCRS